MHYSIKLYLSLALLTLSTSSLARQSSPLFSIGAFNEPQGDRAGLEIAISGKGDYFGARLSGTLYKGGNNVKNGYESNEFYAGFSGFGFVHMGQDINPYLGLGVFVGETLHCTSDEEEFENCVEETSAAIFPELGIEFNIQSVQITPYIRRYFDTSDSRNSGNVYGINFGISF